MNDPHDSDAPWCGLRWRHATVPAGITGLASAVVIWNVGLGVFLDQIQDTLLLLSIVLACLMPLALLVLSQHRWTGVWALVAVAWLFTVNLVSLSLPRIGIFADLDWNWQGKTLDLIWCLLLIGLLSPRIRREIGWTWTTYPGTLPVVFINIVILVIAGFFMLGSEATGGVAQEITLERFLFDASYPNLVEEIVFRGFMLALLDRAFGTRWQFAGARVGWGVVITAWLFGLVHGTGLDVDGTPVVDLSYFGLTFIAGLLFGWIRALTGSLWPAYLAHAAPEAGILLALLMR